MYENSFSRYFADWYSRIRVNKINRLSENKNRSPPRQIVQDGLFIFQILFKLFVRIVKNIFSQVFAFPMKLYYDYLYSAQFRKTFTRKILIPIFIQRFTRSRVRRRRVRGQEFHSTEIMVREGTFWFSLSNFIFANFIFRATRVRGAESSSFSSDCSRRHCRLNKPRDLVSRSRQFARTSMHSRETRRLKRSFGWWLPREKTVRFVWRTPFCRLTILVCLLKVENVDVD